MPRGTHLQQRDMDVLDLLAHRQIDNLDYFHKQFWADAERKSAYNRLTDLARAGYLEHIKRADPTAPKTWKGRRAASEHLFTLGPKAPTALRIRGRASVALARRHRRGGIPAALIDHQLATNRVGDWLGTRLFSEHDAAVGLDKADHKHRPDGAYRVLPDADGRDLMLVETDLGHYSEKLILDKVRAFANHERARGFLFACPTTDRADTVARWIRETYGVDFMRRVEVFSFGELRRGARLDRDHAPVHPAPDTSLDDWYRDSFGEPGCR